MTRQRKWQLSKAFDGLCQGCGKKRAEHGLFCHGCRAKRVANGRRYAGCKPWKPGSRGKPPLTCRMAALDYRIAKLRARIKELLEQKRSL